jgi:hypothetical protein
MHHAVSDLNLTHLYIIYPGEREIPLTDHITAIGLEQWVQSIKK